ncbi:peptidoglycan DD-metalloendopeptidase family protein [Kiritimatiellota bacterium B12222]|nr:peptidoglycan DD-metalloendopeptidase family protein [Kiritimatiellota bacterium B12222]
MTSVFGFIFLLMSWPLFAQTRTQVLPQLERKETQILPVGSLPVTEDSLLMSLGYPHSQAQAIQEYKRLGTQAVPGLVAHLQHPHPTIRMLALSALQYAWLPGTEVSVLPLLTSRNDAEAKSAWYLLKQKMDSATLSQWATDHFQQLNAGRVADLLVDLEREGPDVERMLQLVAQPRYWNAVLPCLPRYRSELFTPFTRQMAVQVKEEALCLVIACLIQQADRDPMAHEQMSLFLQNADPRVREMAAEYYRWHGGVADQEVLETALASEFDPFAGASMREALRMMAFRGDVNFPASVQPFEAVVDYARDVQGDAMFVVRTRVSRLRQALGYGDMALREEEDFPWVLFPPTRTFLSQPGNSFGFQIGEGEGPFAESVHLAQDVSWGEEMATVLSISPGEVKLALVARPSWGGLVVMEHRSPTGKVFCSLYGHLGPLVTVQVGEFISAGTKLGSLGRSYTAENGGYESHLHFGIYDAAYGDGSWVTGYMTADDYMGTEQKWLDPYRLYQGHR